MKHICTYFISVLVLAVNSFYSQGQTILTDTLSEFVFVSELSEVPEVYQRDSIALRSSNALTLVDAIRGSQALYIKDYGPGNIANLTLRGGTAQQVAVFWNGMPVNSPTLGLTDISLLPRAFFSTAVLSPGSSSLLSGAGGLTGGLYLSSSPRSKLNTVDLQYTLAPYLGASSTQAIVSCSEGKVHWRTGMMISSADNEFEYKESGSFDQIKERENASNRGTGLSNDVKIELSERADLTWSFHYLNQEREIASPIGIPNREESQYDEVFRKSMSLNHRANNVTHSVSAGLAIEDQKYQARLQEILSNISTKRYHLRYQGIVQVNSRLLISTRLQHDKTEGRVDKETKRNVQETGLFIGAEKIWSDRTMTHGGLRIEMMNGQLNPIIASIGFEHRPLDNDLLKFRANASKNFRNPTLNDLYWPDLGNPDLAAEEGISFEGGLHWSPELFEFSFIYFQNLLTDQIIWTPDIEGMFRPQNVSRTSNKGIESRIDIRNKIVQRFQIAYTYTDSEVERRVDDGYVRSLYQPEHILNVSVWDHQGPFDIGCTMSFSSEVRTDYLQSSLSLLDPVLLIDTHLDWSPDSEEKRISLGLSVRNLMNKNYEYIKDRPIPGRYIQFNFKLHLYETN